LATRIEKELARRGNKVNSIKDRIAEFNEMLRLEQELEQEAKNTAVVELVRNMNISYSDLKNAVTHAKAVTLISEPPLETPPKRKRKTIHEPTIESVVSEPENGETETNKNKLLKENHNHEAEII